MTAFAVWISGTWTEPPSDARPASIGSTTLPGAPVVRKYSATARTGNAKPAGVNDELYAVVGRTHINATGRTWWYSTVGLQGVVSKEVAVKLYNPETNTWTAYTGDMWNPDYGDGMAGLRVRDFMVRITNLRAI